MDTLNKACYGKDCNVFDFVSEAKIASEIGKQMEKNVYEESSSYFSNKKMELVIIEEEHHEETKIRTPDTNVELDEGVMKNEIINSRDVIFDKKVLSKELAEIAVSIILKILEENRKRIKYVKSVKTDEEDRELYDRLCAFLSDCQKIIGLRESEMIHGLILLEKVYEKHGKGNDFHSNFVDLIFYLATCLILAHKFNSDTPITNEDWCDIGNMSLSTINSCESHTLWLLKYELWVDERDVECFKKRNKYGKEFEMIKGEHNFVNQT
jgi:hypothetical protein